MCSEVEGPGKRFVLWVQGCKKRCDGCCNPHMQEITIKNIYKLDHIQKMILEAKSNFDIEGITLLGGEPMLQAKALYELSKWCHSNSLSVVTFTGYTLEELEQLNYNSTLELFHNSDIVIDGAFDQTQLSEERGFIGSKNQKVYYNTDRYEDVENKHIGIELSITNTNEITINGWPLMDILFK